MVASGQVEVKVAPSKATWHLHSLAAGEVCACLHIHLYCAARVHIFMNVHVHPMYHFLCCGRVLLITLDRVCIH